MADCDPFHCDHVKTQWSDAAGTHIVHVCCNCGREWTEHIRPEPGRPYDYQPQKHGPFAPSNIPRW